MKKINTGKSCPTVRRCFTKVILWISESFKIHRKATMQMSKKKLPQKRFPANIVIFFLEQVIYRTPVKGCFCYDCLKIVEEVFPSRLAAVVLNNFQKFTINTHCGIFEKHPLRKSYFSKAVSTFQEATTS